MSRQATDRGSSHAGGVPGAISPGNLVLHELIDTMVKASKKRGDEQAIEGRILDETKNTFTVERSDGRTVVVIKRGTWFQFMIEGDWFKVDGDAIALRPHERPKKIRNPDKIVAKVR